MQLVVHVDKQNPPTRTAALAATATAVAALLSDPRTAPGGPWHGAVDRWAQGRIRKHCRRARGAAWTLAQDVPGVTVEVGAVSVRSFVPTPTDEIPPSIAKLQLSGTELSDADNVAVTDPRSAVAVSICPEPHLTFGKAAAAAGHAAQLAALAMSPQRLAAWRAEGFPVAVEHPDPARWAGLLPDSPVVVVDSGLTEIEPGTTTALARWV